MARHHGSLRAASRARRLPGGVFGVADSQHPKGARKTYVGQCSAQQILGSFLMGQSGTTRSSISIHP